MPNQDELRGAASEALALARSMILCGEKMSPQAEAVFDRAKAALAAAPSTAEAGPSDEREWTLRWDHRCLHHHIDGPTDGRETEGITVVPKSRLLAALAASPAPSVDTEPSEADFLSFKRGTERFPEDEPSEAEVEAAAKAMWAERFGNDVPRHSGHRATEEGLQVARAGLLAARAVKEGDDG